jgi:hypothetical protein
MASFAQRPESPDNDALFRYADAIKKATTSSDYFDSYDKQQAWEAFEAVAGRHIDLPKHRFPQPERHSYYYQESAYADFILLALKPAFRFRAVEQSARMLRVTQEDDVYSILQIFSAEQATTYTDSESTLEVDVVKNSLFNWLQQSRNDISETLNGNRPRFGLVQGYAPVTEAQRKSPATLRVITSVPGEQDR